MLNHKIQSRSPRTCKLSLVGIAKQFVLQCRHKPRNRLDKSWKYSLYIGQRNL